MKCKLTDLITDKAGNAANRLAMVAVPLRGGVVLGNGIGRRSSIVGGSFGVLVVVPLEGLVESGREVIDETPSL